ncbi:MAG TPA: FG-GAP-like repeat-containing protein [Phycisphaerae bacterium]|jgi:hypothetical protein|nr:FG-GAP-like repeat-containing protein [Phycisphaerae bacterium]HPC20885.1 FG-GAP-like repeat-containing protein [Phycisphaerae bacterium]HRS27223.1 FG-GAP-like repeat-containing protein [Phycisphaerae bacterium]HRT40916.1 FG-GAP-like repeat-containing protein [Phycisphaerae bacterium]
MYIPALESVLLKPLPIKLQVAQIGSDFEFATISDVEVADLDGDGQLELAVAWFATDQQDASRNARRLVIYRLAAAPIVGLEFTVVADLNLYIPDYEIPALSIFRNGTADIGIGDFDGDGDLDLAVHAFFGDELWFIENLGGASYQQYLMFPFYFNTTGNFITPPESLAGDFDGDGRDELVYIADPILQIDGQIIHFWKTDDTIANMYRVEWEALEDPVFTQWTRGLAVADFDGDGRSDLAFTGTMEPPYESGPILTIWYGLDPDTRQFHVHHEYPDMLCSDVVAVRPDASRNPGVILSDLDGTKIQYWAGAQGSQVDLTFQFECGGFAGLSPERGMTLVTADINGDGYLGVLTKQKRGHAADANQVQVARYRPASGAWTKVAPDPLNSSGFENWPYDQILRPRNLAAGDALGNGLPEVFAAFGPSHRGILGRSTGRLEVAIWQNSCAGDVNGDGWVGAPDLRHLYRALGTCRGAAGFNPNADIDKNGCIDLMDLGLLVEDLGCVARDGIIPPCGSQKIGDSNCDGVITVFDINPFIRAVSGGEAAWSAYVGESACHFWCVNDVNGDGKVDAFDIDIFIHCMLPAADLLRGG